MYVPERPKSLVKGRVNVVTIQRGNDEIHIYNVHNHGITREQIELVKNSIDSKKNYTSKLGGAQTIWLGGDFNFMAGDEIRLRMEGEDEARDLQRNQNAARWKVILQDFTEFCTPEAVTHFDNATSSFSRIDRIYTHT